MRLLDEFFRTGPPVFLMFVLTVYWWDFGFNPVFVVLGVVAAMVCVPLFIVFIVDRTAADMVSTGKRWDEELAGVSSGEESMASVSEKTVSEEEEEVLIGGVDLSDYVPEVAAAKPMAPLAMKKAKRAGRKERVYMGGCHMKVLSEASLVSEDISTIPMHSRVQAVPVRGNGIPVPVQLGENLC